MRKILIVLVVLAALFGAWLYASPWYTLSRMKSAAEAGDADRLSAYVDYDAVRADLKSDLRRMLAAEMAKPQAQGFEALGAAIAAAMLDPMIDAMVTPEGVEAMFAQQARSASPAPGAMPPASRERFHKPPVEAPAKNPVIERRGIDEFRVRHQDPAKGAILFRRHGLGWKMAGFDLPKTGPAN